MIGFYADNVTSLESKVCFLIENYNDTRKRLEKIRDPQVKASMLESNIKWTRSVKRDLQNNVVYTFNRQLIAEAMYRPFIKKFIYFSPQLNEMPNMMPYFFGLQAQVRNKSIVFTDPTSQKPFMVLATDLCPDMHLVGAAAGSVVLGRSRISGEHSLDNITDWSLKKFRDYYQDKKITKDTIFHYVYGLLHHPYYREKYALNLKQEFPHIPFYADFHQWVAWGKQLMDLHIGYEDVAPYALQKIEVADKKGNKIEQPECKLKADKETGCIILDTKTTLAGIPKAAWDYKLGNRSAIEWVLDQYKESKPKDPTIREKFNTYRFADYKDHVIDLLMRVTKVSVETMKIIDQMKIARTR